MIILFSPSMHGFSKLFRARRFRAPQVLQEGQPLAILTEAAQIQRRIDASFAPPGIGDDISLRRDDQRTAAIAIIGVRTDPVHSNDIGLVFDRASLQQRYPVLNSFFWKVCDDGEEFRPVGGGDCAEDFRKPQVIANERGDIAIGPLEDRRVLAGGEAL